MPGSSHKHVTLISPNGQSVIDDATDSVNVTIVGGAGSGGTSMTDDAVFVPGTGGITPAGGIYRSVRDSVDDNDAGALAMTQKRALLSCLETPAGDTAMDDTNDAVRVNIVAGGGAGGTSSNFGSAVPSAGTAAGFSDGTNMQLARVFDGDSGAGTEYVAGVGLRKIASGGTVEAGTLADPLRTDPVGTTAQPVTDNGGSLTIDGTVTANLAAGTNNIGDVDIASALPAGDAVIGRVKLSDGTDVADVLDLTNSNPLVVAVVDATGDQITSFGGGVQYTEGDVDATITGTAMLMEGATNTLLPVQGTVADGLLVNLGANNDVTVTGSVTANAGTNLNTSALALESGGNLAGAATSLALLDDTVFAEDVAAQAADKGIAILAVRRDADTSLVGTDNDYANLQVNANGALKVEIFDGGDSHTIDGTVTANAGTNLNTSLLALESGGNLAGAATSLAILDDWDETDRCKVNPIAGQAGVEGNTGVVTALTQRVTLATDVALPAGTNAIGKLAANTGVDIGDVDVTSVVPGSGATNLGKAEDAAHTTGDVGVMALGVRAASPTERSAGPTDGDYEPFATNEVGAVWVTQTPSANGGLSIFRSIDLDETEEDVKTTAGTLYWYYIYNNAATTHFVKFYNATAANVTVGTTTPVLTLPVPAGAAANVSIEGGLKFDTAICAAATTGVADADTGAPAANAIVINLGYK